MTDPVSSISAEQQEMLDALAEEFAGIVDDLKTLHKEMREQVQPDHLESYCHHVGCLEETAHMLEMHGFAMAIAKITENVLTALELPKDKADKLMECLEAWPDMVGKYLANPLDETQCIELVNFMEDNRWPSPNDVDESKKLLRQLATLEVNANLDDEDGGETREFTDEDINLAIPEDANHDVIEAFLQDAPSQAESLYHAISELDSDALKQGGEEQLETVSLAQRTSHTLKGSANLLNLTGISNIAHTLEELLEHMTEALQKGEPVELSEKIHHLMIEACDALSAGVDFLLGQDHAPEHLLSVLNNLAAWPNLLDSDEMDSEASVPPPPMAEEEPAEPPQQATGKKADPIKSAMDDLAKELFPEDFSSSSAEPIAETIPEPDEQFANLVSEFSKSEEPEAPLADLVQPQDSQPEPVPVAKAEGSEKEAPAETAQAKSATGDKDSTKKAPAKKAPAKKAPVRKANKEQDAEYLLTLAEEMSINMVQSQELYKKVMSNLRVVKDQDIRIQERRFELENAVDSRSMAQNPLNLMKDHSDLDPLEMDRYDDIHRTAHFFIESEADHREMVWQLQNQLALFEGLIQQQRRYTEQFQHEVIRNTHRPLAELKSRLQRCVRQAARFVNKQVELVLEGVQEKVDKELIDQIADPLMHILRNAVDHGIEMDRGDKPAAGTINMRFDSDHRNLTVTIRDDGAGINLDRVQEKAKAKGWLEEGDDYKKNEAVRQQLFKFIFRQGFSTKDEATQVSGRGIGLDAVSNMIQVLGGEINVSSEPGKGSVFVIKVPLKQVTRHMLLASVGRQRFALESDRIAQILPSQSAECSIVADKLLLNWQDDLIPLYTLSTQLDQAPPRIKPGPIDQPVLLCDFGDGLNGIVVDAIFNSFDLVVKSMGEHVPGITGVMGITILGDGTLVPVLNLADLLRSKQPTSFAQHVEGEAEDVSFDNSPILVVDDSLSVRNAMKQLLSDSGLSVQSATDGLDAVEKINIQAPKLVLVDMEMPRMNGLELTQYIRNQDALKDLPVIMVTSRSQAKHREIASKAGVNNYLTKPYNENELLDVVREALAS